MVLESPLSAEEFDAIRLSLQVAILATAASLPFGLVVAYWLARYEFPGKWLLNGIVHLPLVMPPVVTGYLLLLLFGRNGTVGAGLYELTGISFSFNWLGAALASAVMGFPLMVRAIRLAFESIDSRLEQVASTLGASWLRSVLTITLPMALPGIVAGAVLAFARSLGEFGATITFVSSIPGQTQTLPAAIYALIQTPGGEQAAMRLTVISILLALLALALSEWLARRVRGRSRS